MKKSILTVKKLCKNFKEKDKEIKVLQDIDLKIYEDDFTVIMGTSGAGKSTLLYSLSGMDRPTSGSVIYNEIDIAKTKENKLSELRIKDFGFIFQDMQLISNLSLFENIVVPGYLNNKNSKEIDEYALELMEYMNIYEVRNKLPSETSGGEKQRCAIARSLINKPKIVFGDEPTGSLNKKNTIEVLDLLTEINRRGQTIIMVTHDSRAAIRASRILYIEDGKIIGELELEPYDSKNEKERQKQIDSWLATMKW